MSSLIQRKKSTRYPGLFVKKYKKRVFYDALWNTDAELLEARGHVEDEDGNIVVRPFTKIFNRGEMNTDIDRDETCIGVYKINGFMAGATYIPSIGKVIVSTTGSLDSDFVGYAEKYITEEKKRKIEKAYWDEGKVAVTHLFEICHPDDPHIIPEKEGAYLIGMRKVNDDSPYFSTAENEAFLDMKAAELGVLRPTWFCNQFNDIVKVASTTLTEGLVVYGQKSKTVLKIKSPHYLVLKLCARKKDIASLDKRKVDEEFFDLIDFVKSMGDEFTNLNEQERLMIMSNYINSRRK